MRFREIATILVLLTSLEGNATAGMDAASSIAVSKHAAIDQYLMTDRSAEISLARSAAPVAISSDATILVLGRRG